MTYKELSKELGISRAHLDRILNNRANVNEKTRQEILQKIEELGFRPNRVGKALALQKKAAFGIIVSSDLTSAGTAVYSRIEEGMRVAVEHMRLSGARFEFRYIKSGTGAEQADAIRELWADGCTAIALSREDTSEVLSCAIREAAQGGVRFVFYSNVYGSSKADQWKGYAIPTDSEGEGRAAGQILGNYLGGRGTVALVSGMIKNRIHQARLDSAIACLKEQFPGIRLLEPFRSTYPLDTALRVAKRLAEGDERPDGLILSCGHNTDMVRSLRAAGLRARVVSFDFTEQAERYLRERLIDVLIGVDLKKMGYDTIKVLYSLAMDGIVEPMEGLPLMQIRLADCPSGKDLEPERTDERN